MATLDERMQAIEQALAMPYFKRNSELQAELEVTKAAHEATAAELNVKILALGAEMDQHAATKAALEAAQTEASGLRDELASTLKIAFENAEANTKLVAGLNEQLATVARAKSSTEELKAATDARMAAALALMQEALEYTKPYNTKYDQTSAFDKINEAIVALSPTIVEVR